jgi:hypothetical protein
VSLRTLTRVTAAVGGALLLAGTLVFAASPAQALEKDRIVIGQDERFSNTYGPLVGANQGALVDASTTVNVETCQLATFCDAIPLTVTPPRTFTGDDAEYYVNVRLSWDTVVVNDVPVEGDSGIDDLDLWIVNDPFDPKAGPDGDGFAYHSATLSMPEFVQMYAPAGTWYLLVNNAASHTLNYKLDVEWATSPLPSPFESLPPGFTGTGTPLVKPSLAAPPVASPPSPLFDLPAMPRPNLALASPAVADAAFSDGFADGKGLSDQLAAPAEHIDVSPASVKRAAPPSGLVLALWMVGFPLLLVAAGMTILQRRREDAFTL